MNALNGASMMALLAVATNALGQDSSDRSFAMAHEIVVPEFARWTISFEYASDVPVEGQPATGPSLGGERIVRCETVKTGEVRFVRNISEHGLVLEKWSQGMLSVVKEPGYPHFIVRRDVQPAGDFPEFSWISAANHVERKTSADSKLDIYRAKCAALQFADPGLYAAIGASNMEGVRFGPVVMVTAYVSAVTREPVKLEIEGDSRTYVFQAPPTSRLSIPEECLNAVREVSSRIKLLVKPLAAP